MSINLNNPRWSDFNWWQKLIAAFLMSLVLTIGVAAIAFFLAALIYLSQLWLNVLGVLL